VTATVVADASALIAFQQIGQLSLLQKVFMEVIVPPAVAREIQPSVPPVSWIVQRALAQPIAPLVLRASLGAGESEALSLAVELRADRLLVDERLPRGFRVSPHLVRQALSAAGGATRPPTE
jgi:predicted nucleic acid-binding protein